MEAFYLSQFLCQMGCNMRDWSWKGVRLLDQPWNMFCFIPWTFKMDFALRFVDFVQKRGLFLGRELISLCSLFSFFSEDWWLPCLLWSTSSK